MTPEEKARLKIDKVLEAAGWRVVSRDEFVPYDALAVKEGLMQGNKEADYLLFLMGKAVGVIEAKRDDIELLTEEHISQAEGYTSILPSWCQSWQKPLPLVWLSNGKDFYFRDIRVDDSEYQRVDKVLTPKEIVKLLSIQEPYAGLPMLQKRGLRDCQFEGITELEKSLKEALALHPKHLSFYALTLEKGTPLYKAKTKLPDENLVMDEYWRAREILEAQGYQMYEISNAALPGFEARHNQTYWDTEKHYFGLGPGAHSFCLLPGKTRFTRAHYSAKLAKFKKDSRPKIAVPLSVKKSAGERIYLGLRRAEGVALKEKDEKLFKKEIAALLERGLISREGEKIKLTRRGIELANEVMSEFV